MSLHIGTDHRPPACQQVDIHFGQGGGFAHNVRGGGSIMHIAREHPEGFGMRPWAFIRLLYVPTIVYRTARKAKA